MTLQPRSGNMRICSSYSRSFVRFDSNEEGNFGGNYAIHQPVYNSF